MDVPGANHGRAALLLCQAAMGWALAAWPGTALLAAADANPAAGTPASAPPAATNLIDELAIEGASLADAAQTLAREAGLNLMVDPAVAGRGTGPDGSSRNPPTVNLRLQKVTAAQALEAFATNVHLAWIYHPATTVTRLTSAEQRLWEAEHALTGLPEPPVAAAGAKTQESVYIDEAPLAEVVALLSEQSGLQVLYEPAVAARLRTAEGPLTQAPVRLRRVSFFQALRAVLDTHGLVMVWSEEAGLARIVTKKRGWEELRSRQRNPAPLPKAAGFNDRVEVVAAQEAPLGPFVKALARLAGVNLLLAPELARDIRLPAVKPIAELETTLDLENLTVRQALLAVLESQNLALVWRPELGVGRVVQGDALKGEAPGGGTAPTVLTALPAATSQPVISLEGLALPEAISALAHQAGVPVELDPKLATELTGPDGQFLGWAVVDLRFENLTPTQALVALVDNYRLAASWDAAAKKLRVGLK